MAVWHLSHLICYRALYRGVRGAEPDRNRADERLHRKGHLGRICDLSCPAADLGFNRIRQRREGRSICITVALNRSSARRARSKVMTAPTEHTRPCFINVLILLQSSILGER